VNCRHPLLVALPPEAAKVRCKVCHLSIAKDDLRGGPCPECYASRGKRQYDFEALAAPNPAISRYRCEGCGVVFSAT